MTKYRRAVGARYVQGCKFPKEGPPKTLRYVGSMVADVHRTLLYGDTAPSYVKHLTVMSYAPSYLDHVQRWGFIYDAYTLRKPSSTFSSVRTHRGLHSLNLLPTEACWTTLRNTYSTDRSSNPGANAKL